ncbi:MAG: dTDP-4-dehydrorhamnose 3,5-epimerase family protein [Nitrospirota bacterium]
MTEFSEGDIEGVLVRSLRFHHDQRGWLTELYRKDEVDRELFPAMAYVSMTRPGVARGPHEHREQADCFVFFSSAFDLFLWDAREGSPTGAHKSVLRLGRENPTLVVVPPGVVHAYRNVGAEDGLVLNFPNRLYAGWGKGEPVDEVRYEGDPSSPYRLEP